jgi:hypothetical protein
MKAVETVGRKVDDWVVQTADLWAHQMAVLKAEHSAVELASPMAEKWAESRAGRRDWWTVVRRGVLWAAPRAAARVDRSVHSSVDQTAA